MHTHPNTKENKAFYKHQSLHYISEMWRKATCVSLALSVSGSSLGVGGKKACNQQHKIRNTDSKRESGEKLKQTNLLQNWGVPLYPLPMSHWSRTSRLLLLAPSDWLARSFALSSLVSKCQADLKAVKYGWSRCACVSHGPPVRVCFPNLPTNMDGIDVGAGSQSCVGKEEMLLQH